MGKLLDGKRAPNLSNDGRGLARFNAQYIYIFEESEMRRFGVQTSLAVHRDGVSDSAPEPVMPGAKGSFGCSKRGYEAKQE